MESAVFIVFICPSIKPLDFGKCSDNVMWLMYWFRRNWENASEENGVHYLLTIFWGIHIVITAF